MGWLRFSKKFVKNYRFKIDENIRIKQKQILEYQQNRDPYLMIDHASKVVPGKSAEGYKFLSKDQWFFKVHRPNDPNMPGMLQTEALIQMSALIVQTMPEIKENFISCRCR